MEPVVSRRHGVQLTKELVKHSAPRYNFFSNTQSTKNQWKIDDPVMKMTFINEILINFDLLFLSDNYLVMT